jgi:thiosulfate dehydrogenase (quinone) large subunit
MFKTDIEKQSYTSWQLAILVILRVMIGWHCLYEGVVKLYNPNWSSLSYLVDSHGLFASFFSFLTQNSMVLNIVDFINIWGLIFIGLGLMLGVFTRIATVAGIMLLGLYYLSHPPLIGISYAIPSEGNYLIINKTLIEVLALAVLFVFPTGHIIGLDRFICFTKHILKEKNN